ncbi:MAG: MFS transporter [Pseudomonadota bacterium]
MPRTPPSTLTLILLTGLSVLTTNMIAPSLPSIAEDLGTSYATVSLAIAGYLAVTAPLQLILGPLSDRVGRRPVLLVGLAVFVAASLGAALAQSAAVFLACRLAQAAMTAGGGLSMAIVRDTATPQEAAARLGIIATAMALAPMLGPMVGGALDAAFGWRSNFWIYAGGGAMLLALVWVDLGETRPPRSAGAPRPSSWPLLADARFLGFAGTVALSTGAFFVFIAGAPAVAQSAFGIGAATLGAVIGSITAGFMAGSFVSSRIARTHRLTTLMLAGRVIACAGLTLGLTFALIADATPVTTFGATLCVGFGNGLTMPSSNSGALSARPDLAGSAAGLLGALNVGTGAALTAIAGALLSWHPTPALLLALMLAVSLGALGITLWLRATGADEAAASPA